LQVETTFSPEFDEWYNKISQTKHGKELLEIEGISRRSLDVGGMSHSYFTKKFVDETVDSNSNAGEDINPNNYGAEIVKGIQKLEGFYLIHRYASRRYGLEKANKLLSSIVRGDVYFHDSSGVGVQEFYCCGVSTTPIMTEGRPYGPLRSLPPKRADSFIAQITEWTMDLSQQFAGAVALGDLFVNYAWYAKKEGLSDDRVINDLQSFVHVMNNTFRVGSQSPFTNLSLFDRPNLEKVFEHYRYPDGTSIDYEYVMYIQKLFGEWFSKGDPASGLPYRFPVVTANLLIENDEIIDKEFLEFISKVNLDKGCFNIYVNSGNKIASCCRLINDMRQFKSDTFGNGGMNLGSHRVVTINLPRIALEAHGNFKLFFSGLQTELETVRDLLVVHREDILKRRVDAGFLKFFNPLKWLTANRFFSTIGIIGVYEMNILMGYDITSEEGTNFTLNVLNYIEDFAKKTSKETGNSYNVEEIPGESVASKLCEKDKVIFGKDSIPFNLYSNQYIPLIADVPIPERIKITGKFMEILSGGGILHLNVKERLTDASVMRDLILYAVRNGVGHLAINYGFGICENGHTTVCGNETECRICGACIKDHITRVIGYFSKVSNWQKTRREFEFPKRVFS
jgi:ribonucleoside-triphosphate reductase